MSDSEGARPPRLLGARFAAGWPILAGLLVLAVAQGVAFGSPLRALAVTNGLCLVVASFIAARCLATRVGAEAPLLVAVAVFGSAVFTYVQAPRLDLSLVAATVAAFALVLDSGAGAGQAQEMYRGEDSPARGALRWIGVGSLLALPLLAHPVYVLLLWPALALVPAPRRRRAWLPLFIGVVLVVTVGTLLMAAPQGTGGTAALHQGWVRSLLGALREGGAVPVVEALEQRYETLDSTLASRNLIYTLAGRATGLVPYFLPLVLLLGGIERGRRRWSLAGAALAGTLWLALSAPHNYFGGPEAVGNRWFLPFYAALWLAPTRSLGAGKLVAVAMLAGLFLWPFWVDPASRAGGARPAEWLPHEVSQRHAPNTGEILWGEVWLRSPGSALTLFDGVARGYLEDGVAGELLLAAPGRLDTIVLEFGEGAPNELRVGGDAVADATLFRPDGRVGFRLRFGEPSWRHRMWWRSERQAIYRVRLEIAGGDEGSRTFDVTQEQIELPRR